MAFTPQMITVQPTVAQVAQVSPVSQAAIAQAQQVAAAQAASAGAAAQGGAVGTGAAAQAGYTSAGKAAQTQAASAGKAVNAATALQEGGAAQMAAALVDQAKINQHTAVTAEDRLLGILNNNSALMRQSATMGNQSAAARGLLNSSMGIQAAQNAMIQNASPIAINDSGQMNQVGMWNAGQLNTNLASNAGFQNAANQFNAGSLNSQRQFDANARNNVGMFNAGQTNNQNQFNAGQANTVGMNNTNQTNQQDQFNAGQSNQSNQFNAGQSNQLAQTNAQLGTQASLSNAQMANSQNQFNAGQSNQMALANMQAQLSQNQFNAGQSNSMNQFNTGQANSMGQFNTGQANALGQFNAGQANSINSWNAGQQNQAAMQTLDLTTRENLANIEANSKALLQTNASAAQMYSQALANMSSISTSDKLDANGKKDAIQSQMTMLNSGLSLAQNLGGVKNMVTFSGGSTDVAAPAAAAPAPVAAAAPGIINNSGYGISSNGEYVHPGVVSSITQHQSPFVSSGDAATDAYIQQQLANAGNYTGQPYNFSAF